MTQERVTIDRFIPVSTDPAKIRFFGTLMPALLLLKASPFRFVAYQVAALAMIFGFFAIEGEAGVFFKEAVHRT